MLATKGVQQDVRSVGRTLAVDTVPQGHLRRGDGRLMLMVELCRASDGSILLSCDRKIRPAACAGRPALRVDTGTEPSKSALHTHTNNPMFTRNFCGVKQWVEEICRRSCMRLCGTLEGYGDRNFRLT